VLRFSQLVVLGENFGFGFLKNAIEPTEDRQRQDDLAVVRLLVIATQQVGDGPNEARDVREAV
jgi:hypothetical protein